MSDPFQGLEGWVREIKEEIREVRGRTGAPRVVLVGFSAGGVAGRKYVVENPEEHGVARLVTLASPHRGSDWAYAVRVKDALAEAQARGGLEAFAAKPLLTALSTLEDKMKIPLDGGLVRDLVPEEHNEALAALNREPHPANLEYACIRAVGAPIFRGWGEIEAELVRLRHGELLTGRLVPRLATILMSAMALPTDRQSLDGDGAVLLSSQDLFEIDYFRRHPEEAYELIDEVSTVDAEHLGAKGRYQAVLEGVESKVRFLDAGQLPGGKDGSVRVFLDFHDYFAGVLEVSAVVAASERSLAVGPPRIYQRGEDAFARVEIGSFDPSQTPAIDVIVRSLEHRGHRRGGDREPLLYGKRLVLDGAVPLPAGPAPAGEPEGITVRAVRNIPPLNPSTHRPWDLDGSPPDLRLVWFAGSEERQRTRVYDDVPVSLWVDETLELDAELADERITLDLWDADLPAPELMGRLVWNPGELRPGVFEETTDGGIEVELEVAGAGREEVAWEGEAFSLGQ